MTDFPKLPTLDELDKELAETKLWNIWSSGYLVSGMGGIPQKAFIINDDPIRAKTFNEAVRKFIPISHPSIKNLFEYHEDTDTWTCWACRLYDNEEDARRTFG